MTHTFPTRRASVLVCPLADCFFDPATALCLKRVTTPDPAQPLTALCEPTRCPNACITARHRPAWERAAADARAHLRERRISDLQRHALQRELEIGRASCRERVCQYVSISLAAVSLKTKHRSEITVPEREDSMDIRT